MQVQIQGYGSFSSDDTPGSKREVWMGNEMGLECE